ncbi:TonB-dependent siderophore receptor [Croceicoccus sp. YJ47]|uniref:TonB-dependent receptor plug domain-containing protein n=1 Tax=Croceicoccus sp. YJ47 TaxID=2798724 RepID=UPI001F1DF655|nr:TonB-dependent receptor [Croceicoccus sp. YJ47]
MTISRNVLLLRTTLCAAAMALSPGGSQAWAQTAAPDAPPPRADILPRADIIVTGRGLDPTPGETAYDTVVLDREALNRAASGRIEDVLQGVAGFQQFRRSDSRAANPSAQGATLRALGGNATSRSLVLLDGIPQANPFFGYIPYSALPPERLSRVTVVRGGGSGAFGAGAVAGTIALESAGIDDKGSLRAGAFVNDRGGSELYAGASPRLGAGFVDMSGRWDRGPGFFTTPVADRVPASARAAYDSWSFALRGVAPVSPDVEMQMRVAAFDDARTLRFDGADSRSQGQDFSLRFIGTGAWRFDALGYVQLRDFSNVVISSSRFTRVLDQRATPSTGLGGKLELRPPLGVSHTLRIGTDLRIADGELREDAYSAFTGAQTARRSAGGRNTDLGFYVEDDWRLGRLVLTAGARVDRYRIADGFYTERDGANALTIDARYPTRAGWQESLRGGAVFDVGGGLKLRAAAYSGLRLPTLNELYRPFVVFPVVTEANAALRNETLKGFEGGFDLRKGGAGRSWAVSLTAFDNRLENAVTNVTIGDNLRQRRNIDAIVARGLELTAQGRLSVFSLALSAAWTDAQNEASGAGAALDGLRPAQTPKFAASATAGATPVRGVELSATLRHEGARFEDDRNTDILPAATTLDAFASVALSERFRLVLRGENLFDEEVVTRAQDGRVDLGTPRTLWVGLRTEFPR